MPHRRPGAGLPDCQLQRARELELGAAGPWPLGELKSAEAIGWRIDGCLVCSLATRWLAAGPGAAAPHQRLKHRHSTLR